MIDEVRHAVHLAGAEIGVLHQRGDHVRFVFLPEYWEDPNRQVLGLWFEDHYRTMKASSLRLPPWFENLLPEGELRHLIARQRGVSADRDMELLAQVGHDLPGAIQVIDGRGAELPWTTGAPQPGDVGVLIPNEGEVKFSLAGVGLKFSMLRRDNRFTLPGSNPQGHEWIVKLPHSVHAAVPVNEYHVMTLAQAIGIDVPRIELVHRDLAFSLPENVWRDGEEFAFAIERFDRLPGGARVHMEDFAQVRGFRPEQKYQGSFETVGALAYRGQDLPSLLEFIRRFTFNVVVGNGDAHLKNWSLLYPDGRRPFLSPAYDLVSTAPYRSDEDLGLKFGGSRRFEDVNLRSFERLGRKLGLVDGTLEGVACATYAAIVGAWRPEVFFGDTKPVATWIERSIERWARVFR